MHDFVTPTGRYNELSFYGCIEMSLKPGAVEALNALADDTYEHELPRFCYSCGANENGTWLWEVKSYINRITICKSNSQEEIDEIKSAINNGYEKWANDKLSRKQDQMRRENENSIEIIDRMINKVWF